MKRHRQGKLRHDLVCLARSQHGLRAAKLCEHPSISLLQLRVLCRLRDDTSTVLAVNIDERPVLLPSSRFRHNALFLSRFSCSLIAVELHCEVPGSWECHAVQVSTVADQMGVVPKVDGQIDLVPVQKMPLYFQSIPWCEKVKNDQKPTSREGILP